MGYYEKDKYNGEPYPGFDRSCKIAVGVGAMVLLLMMMGVFGQIIG